MRWSRVVRFFASLAIVVTTFTAGPAAARRTVIDAIDFYVTGYCSPNSAFSSDCSPYSMPFSVQIGSSSYNSFYVNSNGTVSFGSIESFLAAQNSYSGGIPSPGNYTGPPPQTNLSAYGVPIFSPNFSDGPGDGTPFVPIDGYDGNFVAQTSINSNGFTVNWFTCGLSVSCGPLSAAVVESAVFDPFDLGSTDLQAIIMRASTIPCPCDPSDVFASGQQNLVNAILSLQPIYTMSLTNLTNGFEVDFTYNQGATGQLGTYGYSLPTGSFQATGPLTNQSFFFSGVPSVPEPATWTMMLLGFALIGIELRRKRVRRTIGG